MDEIHQKVRNFFRREIAILFPVKREMAILFFVKRDLDPPLPPSVDKTRKHYLPVVLFTMLLKVVLIFESVDEIPKCDRSNESY